METSAIIRGVHISAQKTRLVADRIRGKSVAQALNILTFTNKKAAGILKKAVESAIANAEHNDGADIDELKVTTIFVDKAESMKRFSARAKGRGNQIEKLEPCSGSLSMVILPPSKSIIFLLMVRPIPLPWYFRPNPSLT